jgi:cyclomaltodextrinase
MKLRISALLLLACMAAFAQKAVPGLASPVMLQSGRTVIVKGDYFPFGTPVKTVKWPEGISLVNETSETYTITGKLKQPVDNIRFTLAGETVDIPCRNTRKIPVSTVIELSQPANKVGLKGSFNAWVTDYDLLKPVGPLPSAKWKLEGIEANEGYLQYKLVIDDKEADPVHAELVSNGMGGTNALLKAGSPDAPAPHLYTQTVQGTSVTLKAENATAYLVYWNNKLIDKKPAGATITFRIPAEATASERSFIRVFACNRNKVSNDILIPLQRGQVVSDPAMLTRGDLHTQIMYFMMVDRFSNGDPANDPKPLDSVLPKANYFGGDLKGIQQKINEGFFDRIGANTLWLSPVSQNPEGAWGYWNKQVTTRFSAYHGYWPTSYSQVDKRFGNNTQFGELITDAHTRNINIVLDFVAHHVHVDHPMYQKFPDWATPLHLPDGSLNTERWDDHRLTTWFDTFLPTLDLQRKEVREVVADSVMFWVKHYDLDGFRHDASKHVPEDFWRLLTRKIKTEQAKKQHPSFYQVGETYGSPELIGSYVNSGQMDGQFDFNLYDAATGAFTADGDNEQQARQWENLQRTLGESFDYYGWHHLMGNISGNQDRPRFASLADGSVKGNEDTKLAGWTREITNANAKGYNRMAQIMALNMTLPGVPVIYYGDEYAMPGGNDPDNRRMMQFSGYNPDQQQLITHVQQLTSLRRNAMPLLYGEFRIIPVNNAFFAYERTYFGQKIMVVFSKNAGTISLPVQKGSQWKPLFNHTFTQTDNHLELMLNNDDVEVFILN